MLPWLERAVEIVGPNLASGQNRYSSDPLSWWHSGHDRVHHALTAGYVHALVGLAQNDESGFRAVRERLASLPYDTPQRLLAEAYRELAPTYVADAFRFLLADPRRLVLGEGGAYDTQKLIESISPLLPSDQLEDLEEFVLSHSGRVERLYETTYDL